MSRLRLIGRWSLALSLAQLVPWAEALGGSLQVKLGPELAVRARTPHLAAELAPGAKPIEGMDGAAAEPGDSGPAVHMTIPAKLWPLAQGTLAMRVRTSLRLGYVPQDAAPRAVPLVDGPVVRVELVEHRDCTRFHFYHPGKVNRPVAVCRIRSLEPDKWYHVAVSWNADTGDVDVFVNGWAQQRVHLPPWKLPEQPSAPIALGAATGEGGAAVKVSVGTIELYAWFMTEAQLRPLLAGRPMCDVGSEVRQGYEHPLDLSGYDLEPIFAPDFGKPLPIIAESTLFEDGQRVREPEPGQWVLEGPAKAFTADGQLTIDNLSSGGDHVVLWLPRPVPEDFLLEFDITVERPDEGLAIVFFAARPLGDPTGSIFKPGLAKRNGTFRNYIMGDVNSYHVSYLAASSAGTMGGCRRSANCRKNSGFWLVACGDDQIFGKNLGRGPHHVRFLKVGNKIRVEANNRLSVVFNDDGKTYGPVWADGYIGLRQMNHLLSAQYRNLEVCAVRTK